MASVTCAVEDAYRRWSPGVLILRCRIHKSINLLWSCWFVPFLVLDPRITSDDCPVTDVGRGHYLHRRTHGLLLARDSIMLSVARYMLSPVRLSVRLSHGWISQKRLKLRSCNFHHRLNPMPLVSSRLNLPRNSKGNIGSLGAPNKRG